MKTNLNILVTNDDGLQSKGIGVLVRMMRQFGSVTAVAPKFPQSGMSMAVSLGGIPVRVELQKMDGTEYCASLDGTPASCVKFAIDEVFHHKPDVVVSGINHGYNVASAANYSGTLGATAEAALNGVPGIGVSLGNMDSDADFSAVEKFFPDIFVKLLNDWPERKGIYYNVNFPDLRAEEIKGIRVGHQGMGHWEGQFDPWTGEDLHPKENERLYTIRGHFVDDTPEDDLLADHHIVRDGFISISAHNVNNTDYEEINRLSSLNLFQDL
jgi:5'-nucleotidase